MKHIIPGLHIRHYEEGTMVQIGRRLVQRVVEPEVDSYWIIRDIETDIVQMHDDRQWYIRRMPEDGSWNPTLTGPMTLREALVRVKMGVA